MKASDSTACFQSGKFDFSPSNFSILMSKPRTFDVDRRSPSVLDTNSTEVSSRLPFSSGLVRSEMDFRGIIHVATKPWLVLRFRLAIHLRGTQNFR
mmetsp:Transcript_10317/g.20629  ORF Transcript_10317/g.20629 Transcript_10317/m.20629 type:complete len:96 (+) Transcript_10317:526-813(+)